MGVGSVKRSPLKRKTPMRRGNVRAWNSTLNRVSTRQGIKNRKRVPVRDSYKVAHPRCERCRDRMWDVHEPWTKARGGPIDDPRNMMSVCRTCHDYIHQHNEESERNGWLIPAALGRAWLDAGGREQDRRAA